MKRGKVRIRVNKTDCVLDTWGVVVGQKVTFRGKLRVRSAPVAALFTARSSVALSDCDTNSTTSKEDMPAVSRPAMRVTKSPFFRPAFCADEPSIGGDATTM